jgi:hypothetical protein
MRRFWNEPYCCIYIARRPSGLIKIGYSGNPRQRIHGMRAQLKFVGKCYGRGASRVVARAIELRTHELLDRRRHNGEWFFATVREARDAVKVAARQLGHDPRGMVLAKTRDDWLAPRQTAPMKLGRAWKRHGVEVADDGVRLTKKPRR